MRIKSFHVLVLCGMLLATQASPAMAGAEADYKEAMKLYQDDNLAEAVPILKRNINENHLNSILLLAYILDLSEENKESVDLLRKAADIGSPQGAYYLGVMLVRGEDGVKKDFPEARKWLNKSIEQGYGPAMVYLGLAYRRGEIGMSVDDDKAYKLLLQAAEKGYPPAMMYLSEAFKKGQMGLPKDKEESAFWNKEYKKNLKTVSEAEAKDAVPFPEPK